MEGLLVELPPAEASMVQDRWLERNAPAGLTKAVPDVED